ncbi:MAG TPA: DinB family protein [Chloroflexota bacterium]|jgi:hypothetical protein|nr:DinB family protein [Chloroflexota bacterium]
MDIAATQPARPRTNAELVARIARSWADLELLVARADDDRLAKPGADGGWSAKDHLAHISAWEGRLIAFLQGRTLADYFGLQPEELRELDIAALNARIAESNRAHLPADVLTAWRATHGQLLALLDELADADLTAPFLDPDDPDDHRPLLGSGVLDGNTYEHYEEHVVAIRGLLA